MTEITRRKKRDSKSVGIGKMACPNCKSILTKYLEQEWKCLSCASVFPVLFDEIPVLMVRAKEHISRTYLQYRQYLIEQKQREEELEKAIASDSFRKENLSLLLKGHRQNNDLIVSLKEQLSTQLLPAPDLIEYLYAEPATPLPYTSDFDYLRRDWAGLPEGELELQQIQNSLTKVLEVVNLKVSTALVLGAGMGRIAYDLTILIDQVIALDQSISMAAWYQEISKGDLPFYEVNPKNAQHFEDMVRPLRATMKDKTRLPNIFYCIGNALALPLVGQSVDAVISAYFTDLIPLEELLPEVSRVLQPGGAFIHFGPLQYHFSDRSKMLSFEEVKMLFIKNNFIISLEDRVKTTHCSSISSSLQKEYNNWIMVAIKQPAEECFPITDDSVLYIPQKIKYEITGQINNNTEEQLGVELKIKDKKFEGAETILDLLRLIDGQKTFLEVLREMEQIYGQLEKSEIVQLKRILEQIRKDNVIAIS